MKRPTQADTAVAAMTAAVVAGPAGAYLQWGAGAALLLACALLLLVSLLIGWN